MNLNRWNVLILLPLVLIDNYKTNAVSRLSCSLLTSVSVSLVKTSPMSLDVSGCLCPVSRPLVCISSVLHRLPLCPSACHIKEFHPCESQIRVGNDEVKQTRTETRPGATTNDPVPFELFTVPIDCCLLFSVRGVWESAWACSSTSPVCMQPLHLLPGELLLYSEPFVMYSSATPVTNIVITLNPAHHLFKVNLDSFNFLLWSSSSFLILIHGYWNDPIKMLVLYSLRTIPLI